MKTTCDVLVIGAGSSGIAAAVTAARAGARTYLIEKDSVPGGIAARLHLGTICGLYCSGDDGVPPFINEGFPAELATRLMRLDGIKAPLRIGRVHVLSYRSDTYRSLAEKLLSAEKNCSVLYSAQCRGVKVHNGKIIAVTFAHCGNAETVAPGVVIDCSGDAVVSEYAQCGTLEPDESKQVPAAVVPVFQQEGRSITTADIVKMRLMLHRQIESGLLPAALQDIALMPSGDENILILKLNIGAALMNYCRSEATSLEYAVKTIISLFLMYLKKYIQGCGEYIPYFDQMAIAHRTGKRLRGRYILTREDVLSVKKHDDAAAKGCWPIEQWRQDGGFTFKYLPDGDYYEIPFGALKSAVIDNLLAAGKCVSTDEDALASVRVIGTCLATGEAAGKYAACMVAT